MKWILRIKRSTMGRGREGESSHRNEKLRKGLKMLKFYKAV